MFQSPERMSTTSISSSEESQVTVVSKKKDRMRRLHWGIQDDCLQCALKVDILVNKCEVAYWTRQSAFQKLIALRIKVMNAPNRKKLNRALIRLARQKIIVDKAGERWITCQSNLYKAESAKLTCLLH